MAQDPAIVEAQQKMVKAEEALQRELGQIRAGRANASILNRVTVDYYGAPTPVNQLATITIPEARVLMITPYDKSTLKEIERAILASDLGLSPANDGTVIRLVIPQLTQDRREELAKNVKKQTEEAKIAIRNIRRDAIENMRRREKNNELTEDDLHELEEETQKITNAATKKLDEIAATKEKEILTD
ncbi:ribosome recycling factor [Loigolactobacillus coryniformis]|uniref:Ribosome-recycling factor n=1 Tax=Loigolactobacillus coryniformis subsp. torquens DSM 20004 = KCTC 3535 TaxID=1423822 RepID=A0A2D1KNG7_9LACO|nr:ribosome recycling factor [Loigolactobacillus coryniformis]ATO43697.1 ribosome recycling factor [Loigolactobacillus coryniformis subsp. torquens DSM 20004 = KCTC 3535]KRK76334.1 ribosome recycling factor [Loigolactobacillus coryniformis subsp. torquens DSM 20004 = KCTC 3535]